MPSTFNTYDLRDLTTPEDVMQLCDNLIPRLAEATGYTGFADGLSEEAFNGFIAHVGKQAELQRNIEHVRSLLGDTEVDATQAAAQFLRQSEVLLPVNRSFVRPDLAVPSRVARIVVPSAVARWWLRKAGQVAHFHHVMEGTAYAVDVLAGTRKMNASEHSWVARYIEQHHGEQPTERQFAAEVLVPMLQSLGVKDVELLEMFTSSGDDIANEYISKKPNVLNDVTLVVSNAPAAIHNAGQLRAAMRRINRDYDANGTQLFMLADGIIPAAYQQGTATHQNVFSGLSQVPRNAMFLDTNR